MALVERGGGPPDPNRPNRWDERQARMEASAGPNKRQRRAETYKEILDEETERMWRLDEELRRPFVPRFNPQALPFQSSTFTTSMRNMFLGSAPTSDLDVTLSNEHLLMAMNDVSRANPFYEYNFENTQQYHDELPRSVNQLLAQTLAPHVDADMESVEGVESWHAALIADRDNPPVEVNNDFEIYDGVEAVEAVEVEEEPDSDATNAYSSPSSEY